MQYWEVIGADRTTGVEWRRVVKAETMDEATASSTDLYIASVKPCDPPASEAGKAPDYPGILTGVALLRIAGFLAIGLGALGVLIFGMQMMGGRDRMEQSANATLAGMSVALLINGVLLVFIASLGTAIRDIARNSFRK